MFSAADIAVQNQVDSMRWGDPMLLGERESSLGAIFCLRMTKARVLSQMKAGLGLVIRRRRVRSIWRPPIGGPRGYSALARLNQARFLLLAKLLPKTVGVPANQMRLWFWWHVPNGMTGGEDKGGLGGSAEAYRGRGNSGDGDRTVLWLT